MEENTSGYSPEDRTLVVTLNEQISVPSDKHKPDQARVFRCVEMSEGDDFFEFFGVNVAPDNSAVLVAKDNIRAVMFE